MRNLGRRKSLLRALSEWLFAGGALIAVVSAALSFSTAERQSAVSLRIEACKRASEAMLDDRYIDALTSSEKRQLALDQLRVTRRCSRDAK
jgi:hypothetical protein